MIKFLKYVKYVLFFKIIGFLRSFRKNESKIKEVSNTQKGKRCFITATGPSLTLKDLELLKNEDTFGVNGIFLMYDKTNWRPTYYACTDAPRFKTFADSYGFRLEDLCEKDIFLNVVTKKLNPEFKYNDKVKWISFSPWNRIYDFENYRFQSDIARGMFAFGTVTNIAIAIAMYMGYEEIYLIGVDCSDLNKHFINDVTDAEKDDKYVYDAIQAQLHGYKIMQQEAAKRNVKVFNATRGGALDIFPRVNLDDLF